jgi:hypothetical protein
MFHPVKGDAAVIEHTVRSGPYGRVGGGPQAKERRVDSQGGTVKEMSRQERRLPGFPAIQGPVKSKPSVPCGRPLRDSRQRPFGLGHIHQAVIVGPGQKVKGVPRRNRDRGLVLPLEVGIPAHKGSARDHIDIPADDQVGLLLLRGHVLRPHREAEKADSEECQKQINSPPKILHLRLPSIGFGKERRPRHLKSSERRNVHGAEK